MPALDKDTFEGSLMVLMKNIGELKVLADADLPWVIQLETQVLEKIRSPERQLQKLGLTPGGAQGGGPPGGMGGMPGEMAGPVGFGSPPPSQLGAGAPPGVMPSPVLPPGPEMEAALGPLGA